MALRAVPEHPKFARLKRTLKVPKWGALGLLESLWHFTGKFTPHGDLGKYPDAEIEAWLEWEGEPGALISALITCGWIDEDKDHRLLVHDWHQHADDATKLAVKRSKRTFVVLTVSRQRRDVEGESDARTRVPEPEPVSKPEPVSEPDHLALTRVSFPSVEVFLTIPLNDKSEFAVTEAKVREWKELYSAIDVRDEIRAYKGWALNNPAKRKTRKGILASLNGWLARRHDKGRSYQNGGNNAANRSQTRTNSNIEALNRSFAEDSIRTRALG
jgi:hypothetical protein